MEQPLSGRPTSRPPPRSFLFASAFALLVPVLALAAGGRGPDAAIAELAAFDPTRGEQALRSLHEELLTSLPPGDSARLQHLWIVVEDSSRPEQVRAVAWLLLGEKADERWAQRVLDDAVSRMRSLQLEPGRNSPSVAQPSVILDWLPRPAWRRAVDSSPLAPEFYRLAMMGYGVGIERRNAAQAAFLASTLPAPEKSAVVISLLEADPGQQYLGSRLAAALLPEARATLREKLAASPAEPDSFHFAAASTLAHLGDTESIPLLRQKAAQLQTAHARLAETIEKYARCIEVQSPPNRLIEFMRTPGGQSAADASMRVWAIGRALELGFDAPMIREAVLGYAAAMRTAGPAGQHAFSVILPAIKREAMRLEIMREVDLPEVHVPQTTGLITQ